MAMHYSLMGGVIVAVSTLGLFETHLTVWHLDTVTEADVPGGGHYRDEEIHLWTFDDNGKTVRMRHSTDTAKHITAAQGQRETPTTEQ
jgi:hypothetical protein